MTVWQTCGRRDPSGQEVRPTGVRCGRSNWRPSTPRRRPISSTPCAVIPAGWTACPTWRRRRPPRSAGPRCGHGGHPGPPGRRPHRGRTDRHRPWTTRLLPQVRLRSGIPLRHPPAPGLARRSLPRSRPERCHRPAAGDRPLSGALQHRLTSAADVEVRRRWSWSRPRAWRSAPAVHRLPWHRRGDRTSGASAQVSGRIAGCGGEM